MDNIQYENPQNQYLQEALNNILTLSGLTPVNVSEHNYWFLRTQSGEFFQEFYLNDYIAIGWDDVPCLEEPDRTEAIKDDIKNKLGYGQPTRVLNQVYRFCHRMKKGDVVIIPSSGSANLAFGRLLEDEYYEHTISEEEKEDNKCPYSRRRKIEWLKTSKRNMIDPKLFSFFRNQQALANANEYAEFIERAINPFYIKDNIAHLNLSVKIKESPKATDIPYYIIGLNEQMQLLADDLGINLSEPEARINVQSDGIIELFGNPLTIFIAGLIIVGIFGGKFKLLCIDIETPGVIGAMEKIVNSYIKIQQCKRNISEEKIKEIQQRLNIEDPREK